MQCIRCASERIRKDGQTRLGATLALQYVWTPIYGRSTQGSSKNQVFLQQRCKNT
jgi:hypothetical protein